MYFLDEERVWNQGPVDQSLPTPVPFCALLWVGPFDGRLVWQVPTQDYIMDAPTRLQWRDWTRMWNQRGFQIEQYQFICTDPNVYWHSPWYWAPGYLDAHLTGV